MQASPKLSVQSDRIRTILGDEYTARSDKLLSNRNVEARKDVDEYMKINVFINTGDSLIVVVNRKTTIQELAKQVEAEHYYRYNIELC
jgi:hypothetical protein